MISAGRVSRPTAISLYSGAGGLDLGIERAGFSLVAAVDNWSAAIATHQANVRANAFQFDVEDMHPSDIGSVDIVLASPPCQGFSSIGMRRPSDPRNAQILTTAHLIAEAKPPLFVIENVSGLKFQHRGAFLRDVLRILAPLSPSVVEIDCSLIGVAQYRKRILIVGGATPRAADFAAVIQAAVRHTRQSVFVRDVLLPVPKISALTNHGHRSPMLDQHLAIAKRIKPGQKLCDSRSGSSAVHSWDVPEVFGAVSRQDRRILESVSKLRRRTLGGSRSVEGDGSPVPVDVLSYELSLTRTSLITKCARLAERGYLRFATSDSIDLVRKFNGRFRRLPLDGYSPAVIKEFGSARTILHPTRNRALTIRECARLQDFPDWFTFHGGIQDQYQLVANAVPPKLGHLIGIAAQGVL